MGRAMKRVFFLCVCVFFLFISAAHSIVTKCFSSVSASLFLLLPLGHHTGRMGGHHVLCHGCSLFLQFYIFYIAHYCKYHLYLFLFLMTSLISKWIANLAKKKKGFSPELCRLFSIQSWLFAASCLATNWPKNRRMSLITVGHVNKAFINGETKN